MVSPFNAAAVFASLLEPVIDSLTIAPDSLPHHYIARAVILDLQPTQMVAALIAVERAIKVDHPHAVRTGWRASSDSLRIYFSAWSAVSRMPAQDGGRQIAAEHE